MFFGRKKVASAINVAFYKDAAHHVRSGSIRVSSRTLGLKNVEVAFSLVDESTLPEITPQLISDIFAAAKIQGYVPHGITWYNLGVSAVPATQADNDLAYGGRMGLDLAEDLPGVLGGQERSFPRGVPELGYKPEARKPFEPVVNGDLNAQPDSIPGRGYNYDVNNILFKGKKIKSIHVVGESPKFFKTDVFEAGVIDRAFYDPYVEKTTDYWTTSELYVEMYDIYKGKGSPLVTEEMASVMYDFLLAIQAPPTIGLRESAEIISWGSKFSRNKPAVLKEASSPAMTLTDPLTQPLKPSHDGSIQWRGGLIRYIDRMGQVSYNLHDIYAAEGLTGSSRFIDIYVASVMLNQSLYEAFDATIDNKSISVKAAFLKDVALNDLSAEDRAGVLTRIEELISTGIIDEGIVNNEANDERFALKA